MRPEDTARYGVGRVDEDGGLAVVELGKKLLESHIPQVASGIVCEEHHTVQLQGVEGIVQLGQRRVRIRQRQGRKAFVTRRWSAASRAEASLPRRAKAATKVVSPKYTPGQEIEVMAP